MASRVQKVDSTVDMGTGEVLVHCAYDKLIPVERLIPNPRNPNRHPERQIDVLAKMIVAQGWRCPITVSNQSGFIVRGHGRLQAALRAGLSVAPVDYQDYENEAAEWADLIADNRIAELAETDFTALADLLTELDTGAFDLDLTGFSEGELKNIMGWTPGENDPNAEWQGMPACENEDQLAWKCIKVNFKNEDDLCEFAMLVGQNVTAKTLSIWFPTQPVDAVANLRYGDES